MSNGKLVVLQLGGKFKKTIHLDVLSESEMEAEQFNTQVSVSF